MAVAEPDRAPGAFVTFGYRPDLLKGPLSVWLDHIRWIAALMVAAAHLRNMLLPDADKLGMAEKVFYFFTLFGVQAVVIFFVLSGLLVGGVIVKQGLQPRKYLIDRSARLYVALIPAVVLSVVLQHSVGGVDCRVADGPLTVAGNLIYLQNFSVEPLCNNHPLWSLSSEAWFYLVGPLLILGIMQRRWSLLGWAAVATVPALVFFKAYYANPLFGLCLWLAGLAPWFIRVRLPWFVAVVPLAGVLLAGRVHLIDSRILEEALLAGSFVLLLCSRFDRVRAPLPRFAAWFSAFSYSLYLVHMPIAQALGQVMGTQQLPNGQVRSYVLYFALLGMIVAVAWLFGVLFEARTRALRGWLDRVLPGAGPRDPGRRAVGQAGGNAVGE